MVHLDLDTREKEIVVSVLRAELSDLSYEISNTDRQAFRDKLKERRVVLQRVAEILDEAQ